MSQIKLGKLWTLTVRDGSIVCAECGTGIDKLQIKSCETGLFYCSDSCADKHVREHFGECVNCGKEELGGLIHLDGKQKFCCNKCFQEWFVK